MSVTVSDLLRLSSLKQAKVVAGSGGLSRIVASLSVLEYADPDSMVDTFFKNDEYYGSEIVITGFMNNPKDEKLHCAVVQRLAEVGEVGLILYYVGLFMPSITDSMKKIADKYNFVLIVMPEKRMDFRYSDAIGEIMEVIVKDRITNINFVGELLDQVSRLPKHQRTVGTMLRMLSERIMASLLLTDQSLRVLNEAVWPLNQKQVFSDFLENKGLFEVNQEKKQQEGQDKKIRLTNSEYTISHFSITLPKNRHMELFVFKEGEPLQEIIKSQVAEAVQLAVNIWSTQHDEIVVTELVRAILQDEPMRMRRLASAFHIDVEAIHSMVIIHMEEEWLRSNRSQVLSGISGLLSEECKTVVVDFYEGELVAFVEGPKSVHEEKETLKSINIYLKGLETSHTITCCNHLADTAAVREAFLLHRDYIEDVKRIFPHKEAYHLQEIDFAKSCREMIERGEETVREVLKPLAPFTGTKEERESVKTLEVFLLDSQCSHVKTGEVLYLHKNTVKYRLQQYSDLLGFHIGDFPDTLPLYYAAAVNRLLGNCPK